MCLAQGPQRSDTGEARTRGPSVSSQALYHWATALPCKSSVKQQLKNRQKKSLMTTGSLMKVESIAECSLAFCNTFDLY